MAMAHSKEATSEPAKPAEMMTKVEKDIEFLKDRIQRMSEQRTPNPTTIANYRGLLDSRILVLDWLREQHGSSLETAPRSMEPWSKSS